MVINQAKNIYKGNLYGFNKRILDYFTKFMAIILPFFTVILIEKLAKNKSEI